MPRYTDKQIITALEQTRGMVYVAAKRLGCSPDTIKKRINDKPGVREALESARGRMGDTAELKLIEAIQDGQPWAIQFYLKTQAKDRGYTDRVEVTGSDGNDVNITVRYVNADKLRH